MYLNIVTDEELMVSQVVKSILIIILAAGIIFNIYALTRAASVVRKTISTTLAIALLAAVTFVVREFRIEQSLLKHPVYTAGLTTGYCQVFARGKGIAFEYTVEGKKYRNCNTFYPVPEGSIKVQGGRYRVRYTPSFKNEGRMDFSKPMP